MEKNIFFIPYYGDKSPYQKILIDLMFRYPDVRIHYTNKFSIKYYLKLFTYKNTILHVHWLNHFYSKNPCRYLASILFFTCVTVTNRKIVWTVHNLEDHEKIIPTFLEIFFQRFIVALSTKIIVHCHSVKNALCLRISQNILSKIEVVPQVSLSGYYADILSKAQARLILGIEDDKFVFLFIGMLRKYKGIKELAQAFLELKSDKKFLIIAGEPKDHTLTEFLTWLSTQDNVLLKTQFIPDDEVQCYLRSCDVVVLPYKEITTSGAICLASAFAKPCITPLLGCNQDWLKHKTPFEFIDTRTEDIKRQMTIAYGMSSAELELEGGKLSAQLESIFDGNIIAQMTYSIYNKTLNWGGLE